jgi:hypothetical protein
VHKLLSGQPIRVLALGGSITGGQGAVDGAPYVSRFKSWIQETFPHPDHQLRSSGFGGGTSSIFALCAQHIAHAVSCGLPRTACLHCFGPLARLAACLPSFLLT